MAKVELSSTLATQAAWHRAWTMPWRSAGWSFIGLGSRRDVSKTLLAPELPPDGGKGIGEGRARLAIPGIGAHGRACAAAEASGEQGYDREQRQQARRGARDCQV